MQARDAPLGGAELHASRSAFGVETLVHRHGFQQCRLAGSVVADEHGHPAVQTQHRTLRDHRRDCGNIEGVSPAEIVLGRPYLNRLQERHPRILAQLTHVDRS